MNHLGVFAKYWKPGFVKTRLAQGLGLEAAARLYREFVWQSLHRFGQTGHSRSLSIWPPDRLEEFQKLGGGHWTFRLQSSGDLGWRMRDFFRAVLPRNSNVVLIGSDSPNLPCSLINAAFDRLQTSDVVIGPSQDGGFYLVGMRMDATSIFDDVPWSTPQVLNLTLQRLEQGDYSWSMLDTWRDIDTMEDLMWLKQVLISGATQASTDIRLLHEIETTLSALEFSGDNESS